MSVAYQKLHERYRAACKNTEGKAPDGKPTEGRSDKARIMGEIRATERESARNGKVLNAVYRGDQVVVESKDVRTKRSAQEEYINKFDENAVVSIDGKEQNLRDYHSKRLLGRSA